MQGNHDLPRAAPSTARSGGIEPVPRSALVPPTVYLLALLPPLFWAGNFIVAGVMRQEIPPLQMSFYRWLLATLLLVPFTLGDVRRHAGQIVSEWKFLAWLSLIGVTAFNSLIYVALHHTGVLNAALLNTLMPVVTFILAFLLLGQRLQRLQILGVVTALCGAAFIIVRGSPARLLAFDLNGGDFLVIAGMSCWALYTVLVKRRPTALPLRVFLLVTFAMGTLFHIPLILWEIRTAGGFQPNAASLSALLFLAVFPSALAYIFWNRAVAALGPGRTGVFMYAMPVFTAVLAVGFLNESIQWFHLVGALLIVAGITLVTNVKLSKAALPKRIDVGASSGR